MNGVPHAAEPDSPELYAAPIEEQLPVFIEQHRQMLLSALDGLSEVEARAALVRSKTTLLGLVKHAAFVERVWFGEAVSGSAREPLGIAAGPDESFELQPSDTVASVTADLQAAVTQSRSHNRGQPLPG